MSVMVGGNVLGLKIEEAQTSGLKIEENVHTKVLDIFFHLQTQQLTHHNLQSSNPPWAVQLHV